MTLMGWGVFKETGWGHRPAFDHAEAQTRFRAGEDIPSLADAYGVTPSTMRQALRRRGESIYGTDRKRANRTDTLR